MEKPERAKSACPPEPDWRPYAGRWVALVRGRVAGVGFTADEARTAAKLSRPKEEPEVHFVPEIPSPFTEPLAHDPLVQAAAAVCAERGIAVCLVGGAVRDLLLGQPVHDWDLIVERDAIPLARAAADRLGAAFYALDEERDTGRVVVRDARSVRTFLDFALRRGPDWRADLEARDLTVNAMALPLESLNVSDESKVRATSEVLLDPFGGRPDLEARLVRAVTERSFRDDPVRMMRAVRLSGELGFQIEPQTAAWIRRDAPLVSSVSAERVRDELGKLLALPDASAGVRQMDDLGLLAQVLPEMAALKGVGQSRPHHWPVFEHTLFALGVLERVIAEGIGLASGARGAKETRGTEGTPEMSAPAFVWSDVMRTLADFRERLAAHLARPLGGERPALVALKLAALLHDCAKPQTRTVDDDGYTTHFYNHDQLGAPIAAERARALRFNNVEVERVRVVVAHHMRLQQLADAPSGVTRRAMYRYFRDAREAGVDALLLALADHAATHGPDIRPDRWERRLNAAGALLAEYWTRLAENVAPPPLVSGHDLMTELGLPPGPRIGQLLEAVHEAQAAGEVATREGALELAKRIIG